MPITALRSQQLVSVVVSGLALYVALGWAMGNESMVRILPGSAAMTLNAALLFIASAWCLWPEPEQAHASAGPTTRSRTLCAWFIVALSGAMLVEHGFGISLGIDWAALHRQVNDGNTNPGRAAFNTSLGFLLTGAAFLAITRNKADLSRRPLVDALVLATLLIGVTALLSYVLNLEGLYQIASYHRMAAPTALGMTLLGLGMWLKLQTRCRPSERMESPDRRIVRTAVMVLSLVVVCAGLGGFAVLKQGFEESMSTTLLRTTVNSAAAFQSIIDQRVSLGRTIAERPGLKKHLAKLSSNPRDAQALGLAREVGQSFLSSGIAGMRMFNAKGDTVVVVGDLVEDSAQMKVAIYGPGQNATMLWQDGFVLRTQNLILHDGKVVGSVVAEQRLTEMTALLRSADAESASTDIVVCGREKDDAVCFPSRFYKANMHVPMYKDGKPYLAASRALLGQKGVIFVKDLRGLPVFAGYAPLGDSGLGMVFKTDSVDLFAPIRQRLNGFVGLLVLLIGAGTLLLRAQIQPLARRLVSEQQRTQAILDSSHEAIIEMDCNGVVSDWNREAEQTFGWTREEALGQDLADLIIPAEPHENPPDAHQRGIARLMQADGETWVGKRIEMAALHRSGASFMIETTISALNDGDERRYTAFLHAITERKKAEADLQAAKQQAESASRAKSDFLANMSHEIRTPMNAILGMMQLMHQTRLDLRQLDYLEKTEAAAKTLLGILNDILDFSKVEAGKMTLDPHPFEIDKLLRNIGVILSASVGSKDVEVLFDIDPALPGWVVGDALRLQQVLINLAGNALKFTALGEVVLSVRVCPPAQSGVQQMTIAVRDSGIGIAPDQLGSIFEGFSQAETSTTRRFGGTGLGLAISQRLVRLMGGELAVDSTPGVGSTFHFTIPFESRDMASEPQLTTSEKLHGLRVLAVDDNASAREVMRGLLTSFGWHTDVAATGAEALETLEASKLAGLRFDVVLIDWRMPDMDGWETSLQIRSLYPSGNMPLIVMVTAYGRELLAQRQAELPQVLDGFLVKPVTASILYDAVADARARQSRDFVPKTVALPVRSQRLTGVRMLVAEDNQTNQQVARELLQSEGATVTIADTGLAAIAAITAAQNVALFDVVLMDVQMPEMDGYTATREIRSRLGLRDLPIIAMTANALPSDRLAALDAGMNDHVAKPFDLTQLIQVIHQCMAQAQGITTSRLVGSMIPQLPGTPITSSATPDGLDAEAALYRFGGNVALYQRVLRSFASEAMALAEQLPALLSPNQTDTDTTRRTLHSLKGLAATVGAPALSNLAELAEMTLPGEWAALLGPLREAIAQSVEAALAMADRLQGPIEIAQAGAPFGTPMALTELDALIHLLRHQNMEAIAVAVSLNTRYAPSMPKEFAQLSEAVDRLDFEAALHCGLGMRQRLLPVPPL